MCCVCFLCCLFYLSNYYGGADICWLNDVCDLSLILVFRSLLFVKRLIYHHLLSTNGHPVIWSCQIRQSSELKITLKDFSIERRVIPIAFKVFNQRLAGFLMLKGFKLISVEPNRYIDKFNIFTFEKTKRLDKAIEQYQEVKKFLI